jgi:hypothetical protein
MSERRLLADIVSITPSSYEDFTRCARLFYNSALLGIPSSDAPPSADQGLQVHDMLFRIHKAGSCHDQAHVDDVLESHGLATKSIREMIARHANRCPSGGSDGNAHEHELARFHRAPKPMFMAFARIDAIWVHDGLLDARDYKTGGRFNDRVADISAARVQAFVLGPAAQARDLRLRLRYEFLQPEIDDDPEPWELDNDDLAVVEEEVRLAVAQMWEERDWKGVADRAVCSTCRFRSICRDSAAPSEPSWPVLSDR